MVVRGDAVFETNETVLVNLTSPEGATLLDAQGVVTINNDEATPALSVADVSIGEGNNGQKEATVVVRASLSSEVPIQFSFRTRDGTATATSDYVAVNARVAFETRTDVPLRVTINGDRTREPNERLFFDLSDPVNATLSRPTATITITNDD